MKERNQNYRRNQRRRAINRKTNILRNQWGTCELSKFFDDRIKGKLNKGKVHCSCWMCRKKSYISLSKVYKSKFLRDIEYLKEYYY